MQGYKTKYLCSGFAKLLKKLLAEKSDQKQVKATNKNYNLNKIQK